MHVRLFYLNRLIDEQDIPSISQLLECLTGFKAAHGYEIHQKGMLYFTPKLNARDWYRCDLTPMLDIDVPNETKLLNLLL